MVNKFYQEKEYELSEAFDHNFVSAEPVQLDNTIILSHSDTRYLYNLSDNVDEIESNEIDFKEKPDDNMMDNEIIEFVPAEGKNVELPEHIDENRNVTEITIKENEDNNSTIMKDLPPKKEKVKEKLHKKFHGKGKFKKGSVKRKLPTSLGIRSKPMSARKRLQRGRGFRNTKGYHASSGPLDFLKKRYKSEYLEVYLYKSAFAVKRTKKNFLAFKRL